MPPTWRDSWPSLLAFGGCWAFAIWQLKTEWSLNPQYAYGWITAPLALFLFWRDSEQNPPEHRLKPRTLWLIGAPGVIALMPLWIIREANPDWRLLNWAFFICAAMPTLAWFLANGGTGRLRVLAFPLLFFMTSIPWLLSWDLKFAQFLQHNVSLVVLEVLLLMGRDAELEGHLIRLATCTVGVDEACSGIRGLQSSVVVGLFLGHFFKFRILSRALLVLAGILFAFLLNLFRAGFLAYLSASKGTDMASRWHDPIGIAESVGTLILLVLLVLLLKKTFRVNTGPEFNDDTHGSFVLLHQPCPRTFAWFSTAWLVATLLLCVFWYWLNEKDLPINTPVRVELHNQTRTFEKQRISDAIRAQLHYNEAVSARWKSNQNLDFLGFYCRWEQGSGSPLALAVHTPEVCLQLRGYRLLDNHDEILVNIPGVDQPVPFEAQTFSYHDEIVHIFRCYWPDRLLDGKFPGFPKQGYSTSGRLHAAFKGFRNPGATMIAIGLFENPIIRNFELAKDAIERELATKINAP